MVLRRIALGLGANAYTTVGTLVVQFLSVPLLVKVWGLSGYGSWLILSTVPTALMLIDAGLSGVAGNRMAALLGAGRRAEAVTAFSTAWLTITVAAGSVGMLAIAALLLVPGSLFPTNEAVTVADARGAAVALAVYAVAIMQMEVGGQIGYRATGRYAEGAAINGTTQVVERVAVLLGALATGSLAVAAAVMAATRVVGMVVLVRRYRRRSPDLLPNRREFRRSELRSLAPLAGGILLLAVGMATSLQGPLLLLGLTVSQATVGLFGAVRTFTRFALQLMNAISAAMLAEFAIASGHDDSATRNEIFGLNLILGSALAGALLIGFLLFGRVGLDLWLPGQQGSSITPLLLVLAAGTLVNGLWTMLANMLLAANRQFLYAPMLVLVALASVALAAWPANRGNLPGVAGALLLGEVVMLLHVVRMCRRLGIDGYGIAGRAAIDRVVDALRHRPRLGRSS